MNVSDDVVWNTVIDILSESNIYREDFKPTNLPSDSQIERKKVETAKKKKQLIKLNENLNLLMSQ